MSEQQTVDPQTPIVLSLNLSMVQGVLTSLGKLPYDQSAGLIDIIRKQTVAQLEQPAATENTTGETK